MLGARADSPDGTNDLMRPSVFVLRIRIATIPKHVFNVKHHPKKIKLGRSERGLACDKNVG